MGSKWLELVPLAAAAACASHPPTVASAPMEEAVSPALHDCFASAGVPLDSEFRFAAEVVRSRIDARTLTLEGGEDPLRTCVRKGLAKGAVIDTGEDGPTAGRVTGSLALRTAHERSCVTFGVLRETIACVDADDEPVDFLELLNSDSEQALQILLDCG